MWRCRSVLRRTKKIRKQGLNALGLHPYPRRTEVLNRERLFFAIVYHPLPWEIWERSCEGSSTMIDICIALDQSVSPHTGVRTIQNTGVFWEAVFQTPRAHSLFLDRSSAAKTLIIQYRQLRRLSVCRSTTTALNVNTNVKLWCSFATKVFAMGSYKQCKILFFKPYV